MFVSVITSTHNRARFIPRLIEMYMAQTYPQELMEWIIFDDGQEDTDHLFLNADLTNVRYIKKASKLPMGMKLNMLKNAAVGDITVVMDDDDYYPPERVASVVRAFQENPEINLAGCSLVYTYFTDTDEVYALGPYHDRHALNCTLAWRSTYTGRYDDAEPCAVESAFLNGFTQPMVQLDPRQTILHIVHGSNTFREKRKVSRMEKTRFTLQDFVLEGGLRSSFLTLTH
jgi:glycosyltransferase involved in cell wall biosynthesis